MKSEEFLSANHTDIISEEFWISGLFWSKHRLYKSQKQ